MKYVEATVHELINPEGYNIIFGKIVNNLHGIMRSQGLSFGIDFPRSNTNGLGNKLRVFGKPESLREVIENPGIREFYNRGLVHLSEISEIPENSQPVQLKRIRRKDHSKLVRKARERQKFFLSKGDSPESLPSISDLVARYKEKGNYPYIVIKGEDRKFSLVFKRELVSGDGAPSLEGFNSYGLSSNSSAYVYDF